MTLAAVTLSDLVELVWVSALVTLTIITAFALAIRGTARAGDLRRAGQARAAVPHAVVAAVCYALVAAAVIGGVLVIALG